jgi:hypothetical protein
MKKLKSFKEVLDYKYILINNKEQIKMFAEIIKDGKVSEGNSNHDNDTQYKLYEVNIMILDDVKCVYGSKFIDDRIFNTSIFEEYQFCDFNGLNDINELPLIAQFILMS